MAPLEARQLKRTQREFGIWCALYQPACPFFTVVNGYLGGGVAKRPELALNLEKRRALECRQVGDNPTRFAHCEFFAL